MSTHIITHVTAADQIQVSMRMGGAAAGAQLNFGNELTVILTTDAQVVATIEYLQAYIDRHMNVRPFPTRRPVMHTGPGTGGDAA